MRPVRGTSSTRVVPSARRSRTRYDVTHGWSPALPVDRLPSLPSALRLAPQTNYSAWATYEAQAAEAGLVLNATLQQALHGLTPPQMAEGAATKVARRHVSVQGRRQSPVPEG